ncbi:MAG: hypothetical protein ACOYVK_07330 [Bacillota bacterium]
MEDKTFELLTKFYHEFVEFKKDITEKVNKNTLALEDVHNKIEIITEVQKSHYEENQKHHHEIVELLSDRMTTVEKAVNSSNIKAL